MTVPDLGLAELVDLAVERNISAVAPWRHLLEGASVDSAAQRISEAGLSVSSLCRGGMFTASTAQERRAAIDDNFRAIEQAATLGAECLVMVCGPVVDKDVPGSYAMVRDGLGEVVEHAEAAGVRLGIEPLHPMMAADRSVITTLGDARDLREEVHSGDSLGVVVDLYHVWWDRTLPRILQDLEGSICGLHVSDWVSPLSGGLTSGRGMMGDGVIDIPGLVRQIPWSGFVEVEVLSDAWWSRPVTEIVDAVLSSFLSCV